MLYVYSDKLSEVYFRNIYDLNWISGGTGYQRMPWIGLDKAETYWRWYDNGGMNPSTTSWCSGEPNNPGTSIAGNIVASQPSTICLGDDSMSQDRFFMCELRVIRSAPAKKSPSMC